MIQNFLIILCVIVPTLSQATDLQIARDDDQGANVVFLRHALAPGYGDPDNFIMTDCTTQRNLSEAGRKQAEDIGRKMRAEGIVFSEILSSQWCRCKETTIHLEMGEWQEFEGLNSFFQGHADKQKTINLLTEKLSKIPKDHFVLMVTHQVVISAITGIAPQSGGAVLYDTATKKAQIW